MSVDTLRPEDRGTPPAPRHRRGDPPAASRRQPHPGGPRRLAGPGLPALLPRWRRVWADRRLSHHHRLVAAVLLANTLVAGVAGLDGALTAGLASSMVLANFLLTVLVRQQRLINVFFAVATSAPLTWPLAVRRVLGKVYHFGGLHVGGALATTAWFALSVMAPGEPLGPVLRVVEVAVLVLLSTMVVSAAPALRGRYHDLFEVIHRIGGWIALLLFGVHATGSLLATRPAGTPVTEALLTSPAVWVLAVAVLSVSSTWWDLRRIPVSYDNPSGHVVIARFTHRDVFAGSSTALSRRPLREWHHFANVNTPGEPGFRLTISRAGDWTGALIDDQPSTLWVKGIPTAGVGNIDRLFHSVLWIATGSGIGPCLPHLLAQQRPAHLVWSTRTPEQTYGDDLVAEIMTACPEAVVWDTTERGKPDLIRLAFEAYEAKRPEAVICISNRPTTWSVVEAFEKRGIPAYGAIWDS